jgi:hypothetical protein
VKRDRYAVNPLAAYASWMKMWQLATIAPVVIGYRLAGMAVAGPEPTARDREELARMGQEKVDAWFEAAQATGMRVVRANMAMATLLLRQAWGGAPAPAAFANSATKLSSDLLADILAPYHRRVLANSRRLSRTKGASPIDD